MLNVDADMSPEDPTGASLAFPALGYFRQDWRDAYGRKPNCVSFHTHPSAISLGTWNK